MRSELLWTMAAVVLSSAAFGGGTAQQPPSADGAGVNSQRLAALEFPWAVATLPDGRLLITEKPGRLRIYEDGRLSDPIEGVPRTTYRERKGEQGGLLDVVVDPDFAQNRRIYLSYSEAADTQSPAQKETGDPRFGGNLDLSDNLLAGGAVARATLDGTRLTDLQVIWRQEPKTVGRGHFGHRMVFGPGGALFIASGDRMRFDPAQETTGNLGKIVRINPDGSIPNDNPHAGKDLWSLGHRNVLALAVHPSNGQLWALEMGPLGGDELNLIDRGANYGWPVVSNGDNYDMSPIPDHPTRPEFKAPVKTWTPVISPSGALFYTGSLFPWKGDLIAGGLSSQALIRLTLDGTSITGEHRVNMGHRIRDVAEAADGALLVITDEKDGALLRLTPARPTDQK